MKKRLISMLMAVLMIASLLPASAVLADDAADNCAKGNHEYTTVKIQKDTEKKTPGVEVKVCKHCNYIDESTISIKAFALLWNQCKPCEKGKTMTVITATCRNDGLTVSYCEKCGKAFANKDFGNKAYKIEDALDHVYGEFKVIQAPKCTTPGYGYAVCKLCGDPTFVADEEEATGLLKLSDFSDPNAFPVRVREVYNMFAPTNPDHDKLNLLVSVTKETEAKDADDNTKTVILKPAKAATHFATVNGQQYKHADKTDNYVAIAGTTDFEAGYTGDKICPDCGVGVKCGEPINHTYVNAENGEFPVYNDQTKRWENGSADTIKCNDCRYKGGAEIKHLTQWYDESSAVPATCEKAGKNADLYWIDNDNTVKHTTGSATRKLGHNFVLAEGKKATCLEPGFEYVNYRVCTHDGCTVTDGNDKKIIKLSSPGKHDWQLVAFEGAEATCQHNGLSYKECKVCHEKYLVGNVLYTETTNMVAHTASDKLANVKEATCTEEGYTGDVVCKFCGEVMKPGEKTKMVDHTPVAVEAKAPTCTEPGISKGTVCKVCEKVLSGQETVPALGHDPKLVNAKNATCTEAGYTGDKVCTRCNVTLEKGKDIKALGHNFVKGVCSRCDAKQPGYNPFSDVKSTDRFYSDIMWAWENGIVEGDDTGMFRADGKLTRAQVVTMLWRMNDKPTAKNAATFTDLTQDWYKAAVAWAVEKGIVNGVGNNKFAPNETCTRAQIVTMLWRLDGEKKVTPTINFTDLTQNWYKDAVAWAANNGITKGDGAGHFYPANDCTRGEAVAFIHRTAMLGK